MEMTKTILRACLFGIFASAALATPFATIPLAKGEVQVFDMGEIKLHAYKTSDFIQDEVFIVEKNGQAVVIELPCFFDNIAELTAYLEPLEVKGIFVAYHGAGGTFMPHVPRFSTKAAIDYSTTGGGQTLIQKFAGIFGDGFDSSVTEDFTAIEAGKFELAGIRFMITETHEAFDIEIPKINSIYIHMLGHDSHSIVGNAGHANAMIAQLESLIAQNKSLILSSHSIPEGVKEAQIKVDYLKAVKTVAESSSSGEEFKARVLDAYPDYNGATYLDITAGCFFP